MNFEASLPYDANLVWTLLTDVSFLEASARKTGATEQDAHIEQTGSKVTTRLHWRVPTIGAPKMFNRWLPEQVDLVEETAWETADTTPHAEVTVHVPKAPVKAGFSGRAALETTQDAARYKVDGEESVGIPWPAEGAAKAQLAKLLSSVLTDRVALAREWLDAGYTAHGWTPPNG
jgi:hypothetical protein